MGLSGFDIVVFVGYCVLILGIGLWVSRDKDGSSKKC
jgi:SSS family solute:Na+ symporter